MTAMQDGRENEMKFDYIKVSAGWQAMARPISVRGRTSRSIR